MTAQPGCSFLEVVHHAPQPFGNGQPPGLGLVPTPLRGPVVEHKADGVALCRDPFHDEDIPREEALGAVADVHRAVAQHAEAVLAVDEGHVDAAPVGRVVVHIAVAGLLQRCTVAELAQHIAVLHLGEAHDIRQVGHSQGLGDALQLGLQLAPRPVHVALRRELVVVGMRVVAGVEEVLHVPPHGAENAVFLCHRALTNKQGKSHGAHPDVPHRLLPVCPLIVYSAGASSATASTHGSGVCHRLSLRCHAVHHLGHRLHGLGLPHPAVLRQAEDEQEEHGQHTEPDEAFLPPRHLLVGEGVFGDHFRILGHRGQRLAEGGVDLHVAVDGPAVGVEHGAQVALAQLEPCQQHRRAADEEHHGSHEDDDIVPLGHDETAQHAEGGTYGAEGQADGGEDTGELGYVERRCGLLLLRRRLRAWR